MMHVPTNSVRTQPATRYLHMHLYLAAAGERGSCCELLPIVVHLQEPVHCTRFYYQVHIISSVH